MSAILQIQDLNVRFDTGIERVTALNHITFDLEKKEILGIIGASGSGKSTLIKLLLGLESPNQTSSGVILHVNSPNSNLLSMSREEWRVFRKKSMALIFQNPLLNLNPSKTILQHVQSLLELNGVEHSIERIGYFLGQAGLTQDQNSIIKAYPHQLSGGQQQRVLIAMALAQGAEILVLDEPFSSLDIANQKSIIELIKSLVNSQEISVIVASHDLDVIGGMADKVIVLQEGNVIESGSAEQLLRSPNTAYTKDLLSAKDLIKTNLDFQKQRSILEMKNVHHSYKKGGFLNWGKTSINVLEDFSLQLFSGEILGIVGPSGAGKTTIVNLILGQEEIQRGVIEFKGLKKSLSFRSAKIARASMVSLISQNAEDAFNPRMLLKDQLLDVWRTHHSNSSQDGEQTIVSILRDLDLKEEMLGRYPSELSGGQIQRMAIARALIVRPGILILDESLSALDMIIQRQIIELIQTINQKLGTSIIIISHDDRIISAICHRVITIT